MNQKGDGYIELSSAGLLHRLPSVYVLMLGPAGRCGAVTNSLWLKSDVYDEGEREGGHHGGEPGLIIPW